MKKIIVLLIACANLYGETDESKAIVSYIQGHIKKITAALPEKIKNKAPDIDLIENFITTKKITLEKIPDAIIKKCNDIIFRESLFELIKNSSISIVSEDATIQAILQKLTMQDMHSYFAAQISMMISHSESFSATLKTASAEVKNCVLLELLLLTASQFETMQAYQKSDAFKKNETFIDLAIKAGAHLNDAINTLPTLSLSAQQQERELNSLFAPHADFIAFLINNGLDKNFTLPVTANVKKKQTLPELYEDQLKDITEKLKNVVSTELTQTQSECKKILDLLKPKTPPAAAKA